jgi:hypothetical protein
MSLILLMPIRQQLGAEWVCREDALIAKGLWAAGADAR